MNIPERLLANRCDPEWRAVLEDCILEQGGRLSFGELRLNNYNYNNNYNNNYNYNHYHNNYNYNNNYNNYYNNYNNYNNNYNNYSSNYNYYNYYNYNYNTQPKGFNVQNGLKAISIPYGYTVTWIVGHLERVQGDEFIIKNARRIKSIGDSTPEAIIKSGAPASDLAETSDYEVHRLQILSAIVPGKVWEDLCK